MGSVAGGASAIPQATSVWDEGFHLARVPTLPRLVALRVLNSSALGKEPPPHGSL